MLNNILYNYNQLIRFMISSAVACVFQTAKLSSVFALYTICGFPKVTSYVDNFLCVKFYAILHTLWMFSCRIYSSRKMTVKYEKCSLLGYNGHCIKLSNWGQSSSFLAITFSASKCRHIVSLIAEFAAQLQWREKCAE